MRCVGKLAKSPGVYRITNTINGLIYIGSSKNVRRRFGNHRRDLEAGRHRNSHLMKAWGKYGPEAFTFDVIEEISDEDARLDRETELIASLRAHVRGVGYNISKDARLAAHKGLKRSPETRKKMSLAFRGRINSPEARARLSASQKERHKDPAVRERTAAKKRGVPLSDEHRAKLSVAGKGKAHTEEAKEKMRQRALEIWARPGNVERRAAAAAKVIELKPTAPKPWSKYPDGVRHSPETRAKMSAIQKRIYAETVGRSDG